MTQPKHDYDIIIVGGGLVGASLAKALAHLPLHIAIIEAKPLQDDQNHNADPRAIALAYGSTKILSAIGVWPDLIQYSTAINTIHVSDQGHFGSTVINAHEEQVSALGHVISINKLNHVLHKHIKQHNNIDLFQPATVTDFSAGAGPEEQQKIMIHINEKQHTLHTKLLIAADGSDSFIRKHSNIKFKEKPYDQRAILTLVALPKSHQNIAYERFTQNGSIALLPQPGFFSSLVWATHPKEAARLLELTDDEFLGELQTEFGYRLGRFRSIAKRYTFPLKLTRAAQSIKPGIILLGNAAQTMHPVAAQGFNLSLRNVALLVDLIDKAHSEGKPINDLGVLCQYEQQCQNNQNATIGLTQLLTRLFGNTRFPAQPLRDIGLVLLDILPLPKHQFAKKCMGIHGKLSRLARGIVIGTGK